MVLDMDINVAEAINHLLYDYQTVAVPGLGAFVSEYHPATIDHIEGIIHPPSKSVTFNRRLAVNDGVLYNHLQKCYPGATYEDLQEAVKDYVSAIKGRLKSQEIVDIPEVGRLYQDFENKIQFLQEPTNFNKDSYGLPELHFYPILRSRKEASAAKPAPAAKANANATATAARPSTNWASLLYTLLPYLFGLALLIVAVTIYLNRQNPNQKPEDFSETRLNQKPPQAQEPVADLSEEAPPAEYDEITGPSGDAPLSGNAPPEDTDAPSLPPGTRKCIIIIGAFSTDAGVKRSVKKLYDLGFDVYTDRNRGLTRVGAQFLYEEDSEVDKALRFLRKEFERAAFVLEE